MVLTLIFGLVVSSSSHSSVDICPLRTRTPPTCTRRSWVPTSKRPSGCRTTPRTCSTASSTQTPRRGTPSTRSGSTRGSKLYHAKVSSKESRLASTQCLLITQFSTLCKFSTESTSITLVNASRPINTITFPPVITYFSKRSSRRVKKASLMFVSQTTIPSCLSTRRSR